MGWRPTCWEALGQREGRGYRAGWEMGKDLIGECGGKKSVWFRKLIHFSSSSFPQAPSFLFLPSTSSSHRSGVSLFSTSYGLFLDQNTPQQSEH